MRDLTPVGLSKDGRRLVLVDSAGEEFAVTVDRRLRSALRGDNTRLGQLEMKMESALRPRDIQARIRSGESPETVAAAAQTTVEAIMPFAAPVLAERAHVAQTALGASVRRHSDAPSTHRTLTDAATAHLATSGIRFDDVEWDAWRRDDGRWTLVANYGAGDAPQQAQFTFDQRGRYVVADNDEAKVLTGELTLPPRAERPPRAGGRRLSAVPADDELPLGDSDLSDELGDDALQLVRDPAARPEQETTPEPVATDDTSDAPADASVAATDEPAEQPVEEPVEEPVDGPLVPDEDDTERTADLSEITRSDVAAPEDSPAQPAADATDESGETPAAPERRSSGGRKGRRKGRSSMPSWDEIMFGGGKSD